MSNVTALDGRDSTGWISVEEAATKIVEGLARKRAEPLPDGIYFDLDEERYHRDKALGSTAMGLLTFDPTRYWFESRHNPLHDENEGTVTDAQERGRAVHCFVLYGRETFEARYGRASRSGTTKAGHDETDAIIAAGKIRLRAIHYDRILQAGTMITANPFLSKAFQGGRAEVSVFWTRNGIRKRARFDYLKRKAIVDLKSVTNTKRIDFETACCRAIDDYGYLVQAEHYREARQAMRTLPVSGLFDPVWLKRVVEQPEKEWLWCWVFWQAAGAPITWSCSLSHDNAELRDEAAMLLTRAEENYKKFMDRFGPDTPWVMPTAIRELDISDLRSLRRR